MSREKDEKNTQEIRNRILDAAEKLFADKGFDATGITEIAVTAEVTKSLIYYYFESKDAILSGIFDRFMEKTLALKDRYTAETIRDLKNVDTEKAAQFLIDYSFPFIEASRDILKIGLMEEARKSADGPLFAYFKRNVEASLKYYDEAGLSIRDQPDFSSFLFFMAIFPLLGYVVLGEKWCASTGMENVDLRALITKWTADNAVRYISGLDSQRKS
jgi:AcrR family transcriptional regulator